MVITGLHYTTQETNFLSYNIFKRKMESEPLSRSKAIKKVLIDGDRVIELENKNGRPQLSINLRNQKLSTFEIQLDHMDNIE